MMGVAPEGSQQEEDAVPTAQVGLWRSSGGIKGRPGRPKRTTEPARASEVDQRIHDVVAKQFPDVWQDLSDLGRDMFTRALMEAAARAPEDRDQALEHVIDTWYEAWHLLYAPEDDEPNTKEEQAEADAALESLGQGHGIPLEQLTHGGKRTR